jgi:hypothetical protein
MRPSHAMRGACACAVERPLRGSWTQKNTLCIEYAMYILTPDDAGPDCVTKPFEASACEKGELQ